MTIYVRNVVLKWAHGYKLTKRAANVLRYQGIASTKEFLSLSDTDIRRFLNCGVKVLQELRGLRIHLKKGRT